MRLSCPALVLTIALVTLVSPLPSMATTTCTTVTSTDDSSATPVSGTLRYAIAEVNAGTCDTVTFSLTYPATITLQQGQLMIVNAPAPVSINGPGADKLTISGNNASRVFYLEGGVTTIAGVTLANARRGDVGGAIYSTTSLTIADTTVRDNFAGGDGAGIYSPGALTVRRSTFTGNRAGGFAAGSVGSGAAIAYGGPTPLLIENTTFYRNVAEIGRGGSILDDTGDAQVVSSTFSGNSVPSLSGGGTIKNSIVADGYGACGNTFTSAGYNLTDDGGCSFQNTGDVTVAPGATGLDPDGLKDNGGPTQTIALTASSPAVDAIPTSACTDANGNALTADQRGITRPQGTACDIGAFELVQSIPFASFTPKLTITRTAPAGFSLNSNFTLGAQSNGIKPATEAVTLKLGTYSVTFPAGSFKVSKKGVYTYSGTINGTSYAAQIAPLTTANSYSFKASASGANGLPTANPVSVTLTIGNDTGTKTINATFQ